MATTPVNKADVRRGKERLKALLDNGTLSQAGYAWLLQATNIHSPDRGVNVAMPSGSTEESVPLMKRAQFTITKPSSLPSGEKFSVFLYTLPLQATMSATRTEDLTTVVPDDPTFPWEIGTFNMVVCPDGIDPFDGPPSATVVQTAWSPEDDGSALGLSRIVSAGYTVRNVTAQMYKSGSVTTYSMAQHVNTSTIRWNDGSGHNASPVVKTCRRPTLVAGTAAQYGNARTWGAEEGVYAPITLNKQAAIYESWTDTPVFVTREYGGISSSVPFAEATGILSNYTVVTPSTDTAVLLPPNDSGAYKGRRSMKMAGLHTKCSIFSGLHEETVLEVTVSTVVEKQPSGVDPDLLATVRRPPPHDPVAMELYYEIASQMPVAMLAADNPSGTLGEEVLATLGTITPVVGTALSFLFPEFAPTITPISIGLSAGLKAAQYALKESKKGQTKPTRPPRPSAPVPPPKPKRPVRRSAPVATRSPPLVRH
jgi:hypothetical protein